MTSGNNYSIKAPDTPSGYAVITATKKGQAFSTLSPIVLKESYKEHGALLLRDFGLDLASLNQLTSLFCDAFVPNDINDRERISSDGRTQTVNLQNIAFPLHAEMTQIPATPDLACFACIKPPEEDGETTICDGTLVGDELDPRTRALLENSAMLYKKIMPAEMAGQFISREQLEGSSIDNRISKGALTFWLEQGQIIRGYSHPALHDTAFSDKRAFADFLLFSRFGVGCKDYPVFDDGTLIPDAVCNELKAVTDRLTVAHHWEKNDVMIIDNTRFMHGRRRIVDSSKRTIWTQFGYVSFHPKGSYQERLKTWTGQN